jgi:NADPH:quinone reductase-like Zn-dependent oxidoreductase
MAFVKSESTPTIMKAIRLHPNKDISSPYSRSNPASPSALILDSNLPVPQPLNPGEILIKISATTIVKDSLTWPESYSHSYAILGNDFAGTVVATTDASSTQSPRFKPGDEVFGMANTNRAGMWAEYAIVLDSETTLKPKHLNFTEAAVVPLSGLTAYQALFHHAGIPALDLSSTIKPTTGNDSKKDRSKSKTIFITGSTGSVGLYLIQLAALTSYTVIAGTRSRARSADFLTSLGADEVVEYSSLSPTSSQDTRRFDIIIDTVGGTLLDSCWTHLIAPSGTMISVESASYDFPRRLREKDTTGRNRDVKAVFFIVEPDGDDLAQLSMALELGLVEPFVAKTMPLARAAEGYELVSSTLEKPGKVVLVVGDEEGESYPE